MTEPIVSDDIERNQFARKQAPERSPDNPKRKEKNLRVRATTYYSTGGEEDTFEGQIAGTFYVPDLDATFFVILQDSGGFREVRVQNCEPIE